MDWEAVGLIRTTRYSQLGRYRRSRLTWAPGSSTGVIPDHGAVSQGRLGMTVHSHGEVPRTTNDLR